MEKAIRSPIRALLPIAVAALFTIAGCGGGGSTTGSVPRYSYVDITPSGTQGYASAINNAGQVLIDTTTLSGGTSDAYLYTSGRYDDIGNAANMPAVHGLNLNQQGSVLYSVGQPGSTQPATLQVGIYSSGTITTPLALQGTPNIIAFSNSGSVLAGGVQNNQPYYVQLTGQSWIAVSTIYGIPAVDTPLGYTDSGSLIINSNNGIQVVNSTAQQVYTDYGLPAGGQVAVPVFVNSHGQMSGEAANYDPTVNDFLMEPFSGTAQSGLATLPHPSRTASTVSGQNNNGILVGFTLSAPSRPLMWINGQLSSAINLVPFPPGSSNITFHGINDKNQICGGLTMPDGSSHAFVLNPTT